MLQKKMNIIKQTILNKHRGGIIGYDAYYKKVLDANLSVVIFCNATGLDVIALYKGIRDIIFGQNVIHKSKKQNSKY